MEQVILVDDQDRVLGTMDKMEAHEKGILHRAFSILIFNKKGEMLIQKRARSKYHSGGLWTNACCSHPLPNETLDDATRRRLKDEMGIDLKTTFAYSFLYHTPLDKNLIEHELDHVFIGEYNGVPDVNPTEVEDWKYVDVAQLKTAIVEHPELYTHWFKLILNHSFFNQHVINRP